MTVLHWMLTITYGLAGVWAVALYICGVIGRRRNWLVKGARIAVFTRDFPEGRATIIGARIVSVGPRSILWTPADRRPPVWWRMDSDDYFQVDSALRSDEGITWVRGADPSPLIAAQALLT